MGEFNYEILGNPEIFCEGRLSPHADAAAYRSEEEALREEGSAFRLSLDGKWKYRYASCVQDAPKDFMRTDGAEDPCRSWGEITVPGHPELQGYGSPQYVNTQYPWDGHEDIRPGEIPVLFNPVGSYVKYFTLPEGFLQDGLVLRLEGAESGTAVWLNGSYVGYTEDSFTAHEFDLVPYVREGENKLALQVFRFTSGSWCEDQDFFRLSGIFRSVSLITKPRVHIEDVRIRTDLSEDYTEAVLRVNAKLKGDGTVKIRLLDAAADPETLHLVPGTEVLSGELAGDERDGEGCLLAAGAFPLSSPRLWSAEAPELYLLLLEVFDADGVMTETVRLDAGFREFRMSDDHIMLLNGKRIVFCGVNRHEFSSRSGRAVTEKEMLKDLLTMKRNNINALRMSHYPNQSAMYRLCDRLGIYVIDETNLETHGTWDAFVRGVRDQSFVLPGDHEEWRGLVLDRASSMFERDKNHACILIWSCGNESFGGRNLYEISQYFRGADDTRLVHYEGICHDRSWPDTSDMESRMYPSVKEIRAWLKEHRDKPFVCCEYTHAMGNSCGAMRKYTDLALEDPLYQGGFIWDYIDQTLTKKDRFGCEYEAYGGDFGERPTDWDFSANGIVSGGDERKPTPKMQSVKYNYQPFLIRVDARALKAEIRNLMLFTDAEKFDIFLSAERYGEELFRVKTPLSLAPGEKAELDFEGSGIPAVPDSGETVLRVSVCLKNDTPYAEAGYEAAFGEGVRGRFEGPESGSGDDRETNETAALSGHGEGEGQQEEKPLFTVTEGTNNWGVRGENFEVLFSYLTGGMISYRMNGRELLEGAVRPNFWRAPTQNDIGNGMPARCAQWKIASSYASWKREMQAGFDHLMPPAVPVTEKTGNSFRITFTYKLPTVPAAEVKLSHEVFVNGTVKTTLIYDPVRGLPAMPEFGVMLKMNADYSRLTWYGYGPEETYADRMEGAKLSLYSGDAAGQAAAYVLPQETGNHACTRYAAVTDKEGRGLLFVCDPSVKNPYAGREAVMSTGMSFSALPWTPDELENAAHRHDLPHVHHTVVRLSLGQMGVGGDDTWGAFTHPEYLLDPSGRMRFSFYMKGL